MEYYPDFGEYNGKHIERLDNGTLSGTEPCDHCVFHGIDPDDGSYVCYAPLEYSGCARGNFHWEEKK